MHVPPSPGPSGESPGTRREPEILTGPADEPEILTGPADEPEILTGPADEPKRPGRSRRSPRRSGPAIAVFSVLAVALLGGGAAFALMDRAEDAGPRGRSPETAQQASQDPARNPGDDPGQVQDPSGSEEPEPGTGDAGDGGDGRDTGTAAGQDDTSAGSGGGPDRGEPGGGSGSDSAAGTPSEDKPVKQRQSSPASPPAADDNPLSDGDTGYVHPQGPVGGY